MGRIAVTGSVAYDTIMVFPGRFSEHILGDRTHLINVSFLIDSLVRRRGGTAANISYTLGLLGEHPLLCAAVGSDFSDSATALADAGVDLSTLALHDDETTAAAYITTDLDNNQITAFHPGAMRRAAGVDLRSLDDVDVVVVSPDSPEAMRVHLEQAATIGARLCFAPAQQLPALGDQPLLAGLEAAWLVVGNDYELELVRSRTGRSVEDLARGGAIVVQTLGAAGSVLRHDGEVAEVDAAPVSTVVDPTGAGDAYLAGLLAGLRAGSGLRDAGRLGAVAAAFCIEQSGPQTHRLEPDSLAARYRESFGEALGRAPKGPRYSGAIH